MTKSATYTRHEPCWIDGGNLVVTAVRYRWVRVPVSQKVRLPYSNNRRVGNTNTTKRVK